jgi:hypothetical protein
LLGAEGGVEVLSFIGEYGAGVVLAISEREKRVAGYGTYIGRGYEWSILHTYTDMESAFRVLQDSFRTSSHRIAGVYLQSHGRRRGTYS